MKFVVIGITDHPTPFFPPDVLEVINSGKVFSGGRRHHELVASLLPEGAQWIDITVPLDAVFSQYRRLGEESADGTVVVFASGDPLFFGFANTLKQKLQEADVVVFPSFNSLQMLAHRLVMPYHDMRIVSLTGRPWHEFDRALIERRTTDSLQKIGVLTDRVHTPAAIARRMLDYGYTYYNMFVGEHLGSPDHEKVTALTLEDAALRDFDVPNCLILVSDTPVQPRLFGIPDSGFALLNGREKMITKMPIRLLTLQALELSRRQVFWDIGFCTGSVSIEAKTLFPHLQIEAFEIRPECEAIISENSRRFGTPGIEVHIGDFLLADVGGLRRPDAVFIGGHGGHLKEIMAKVLTVLADDGIMVLNSVVAPKVTTDSRKLWDEACQELGLRQEQPLHIQLDNNHPITMLKCRR